MNKPAMMMDIDDNTITSYLISAQQHEYVLSMGNNFPFRKSGLRGGS